MKNSIHNHKRIRNLTVVIFLLIFAFLSSCNGKSNDIDTYKTFYSQEGDPSFSFQYPEHYKILYQPSPSPTHVAFEILEPKTYSMIHVGAGKIGEFTKSEDLDVILESHLHHYSESEDISNYKFLERGTVWISCIEARYAVYTYSVGSHSEVEIGKFLVFNHNDINWQIIVVNTENEAEEMEAVFWRFIATFKFYEYE